jgi:3-oxoacyl-[acyl-carrier protein] reductase
MANDYLLQLARNKMARNLVRQLGLPVPLPVTLRRGRGPWQRYPLADMRAVAGGTARSELAHAFAEAVVGTGAVVHAVGEGATIEALRAAARRSDRPLREGEVEGAAIDVLVFDASGITTVAELAGLYEFFHARIAALASSGRAIVVARTPDALDAVEAAAVATGLEGFVRSLAKELGKKGATAQLLRVRPGGDERLAPALRFFGSPRSAFVDGQVIELHGLAAGPLFDAPIHPLSGKVALVTGAARGIGAATARTLAREGAKVLCVDRPSDDGALARLADGIGGVAVELDITAADAAERLVAAAHAAGGGLDVIVHNAGITRDKTLARMKPEHWNQVMAVNLGAIIAITPVLLERAMRDGGRIVAMASIGGIAGNFGQTNYATTKAGVIGWARALAPKVAARGITVNAIAPGFIETAMTAAMPLTIREAGRRFNALSQGGDPVDIAEVVTFLASPGGLGISGSTIRVCGMNMIGA